MPIVLSMDYLPHLWTENLSRAHRMAEQIESGIVWINCWLLRDLRTPFGGVKDSGVGREGGFEALRIFHRTSKRVCEVLKLNQSLFTAESLWPLVKNQPNFLLNHSSNPFKSVEYLSHF